MKHVSRLKHRITSRATACAGAAVLLLYTVFAAPNGPDSVVVPPIPAMPPTVISFGTPKDGTDALQAFIDRPLFHALRRPWVPMPAPSARPPNPVTTPPPSPPPQAVLLGIITDGGFKAALLQIVGSQHPQIVHEGQVVDGWTVSSIDRTRLYLSNGSATWQTALGHHP